MPHQYSEEEYYPEVSPEEIAHDEEIHAGWKQKDDSQEILKKERELKLLKDGALSSLRLDLKNPLAKESILVSGEEKDQDYRKLKETRTRLCNEYIREVGQDNIERVLNDIGLSLEDKGKILANLNASLNEGLCLRWEPGRTEKERVMYRKDDLIEKPERLNLRPEQIKIEQENMSHVIEGWAIGQLITGDIGLAIYNFRDLARLRGLGKENFDEIISKKIKYFEKARQSSKELESNSYNLKNRLERFDKALGELGYNWDEQSGHYVRLGEEKK